VTPRRIHEKQTAEVLQWLRRGLAIEKIAWEQKYKNNGCRLAPAISQLVLCYGFDIEGSGVQNKGYRLRNPQQYPTRNKVTGAFKNAYYASTHWAEVREHRWKNDRYTCVLCGAGHELQCHHVIYNLFAESMSDIMTVCEHCHRTIHTGGRIAFPEGAVIEHFERLSIPCHFVAVGGNRGSEAVLETSRMPILSEGTSQMAGDWIKIEHALPEKPEVMQIADELDVSRFEVIGMLVKFWSWVDQNLSRSCPDVWGTESGLDSIIGRDGFARAMIHCGWLEITDSRVRIPNYESHLSKSAKTRALAAKKKRLQREGMSPDCPEPVGTESGQDQGLEERRGEEKRRKKKKTPPSPPRPGKTDVFEDLPESLDTVEMRAALQLWAQHRREIKKPLTKTCAQQQLKQFETWGPDRSIAAIQHTILKGWQGIREPEPEPAKPASRAKVTDLIDRAIADGKIKGVMS